MQEFIREISTAQGDVFRISLVEEGSLLSRDTISVLGDIELMGIELQRLAGRSTASHEVLEAIEEFIASVFVQHENVVIFYYCDFVNPIPRTNKVNMSAQEYRSILFEKMFERYIKHHGIDNVHLSVITVDGAVESFYFHLIYREAHAHLVPIINKDLKEGYGKPD